MIGLLSPNTEGLLYVVCVHGSTAKTQAIQRLLHTTSAALEIYVISTEHHAMDRHRLRIILEEDEYLLWCPPYTVHHTRYACPSGMRLFANSSRGREARQFACMFAPNTIPACESCPNVAFFVKWLRRFAGQVVGRTRLKQRLWPRSYFDVATALNSLAVSISWCKD